MLIREYMHSQKTVIWLRGNKLKALCDSKNDIGYSKNRLIHNYKKRNFFFLVAMTKYIFTYFQVEYMCLKLLCIEM